MASNQQQYVEQLQLLQERCPQESKHKLLHLLRKYDGDVDLVRACLVERENRVKKFASLEARFGTALTALQVECPSSQPLKRARLLKIMERFGGDIDHVRKCLQRIEAKQNAGAVDLTASRRQHREELKAKYASQLAELATAGINVNCPCILAKLEKQDGDVDKVLEIMTRHKEKKDEILQLNTKYANQVAQLEADGVKIKNKRLLIELLEKANGQVDGVKQLLTERKEQKKQTKTSSNTTEGCDENTPSSEKRRGIDVNDLENLRQLRSAGVHGNPVKILAIFHECNESLEKTIARLAKEREEREKQSENRLEQRVLLAEVHDAYLTINNRNDWPRDIQQVYLDGNNMMFVVDSLRRLCLNRAGKKTERAIAQIAAAWNEHMHIPNVDLIFDSTRQLDQVDSVIVSSAQPKYKTTDDMLIDIARRSENHEKNKRTIVVTSDRALAVHLKREGCLLVKSYSWFAHCAMVLTPDLIKQDESTTMATATNKTRCNLDELVHRIAKIDV